MQPMIRKYLRAVGLVLFASAAPSIAGLDTSKAQESKNTTRISNNRVVTVISFSGPEADQLSAVIARDLSTQPLFGEVSSSGNSELIPNLNALPNFAALNSSGVRYVLVGASSDLADGRLDVEARFWDVLNQKQLFGRQYTSPRENLRRIAHFVADGIGQKTLPMGSHFDSRIAFISYDISGGTHLAVMDNDGANPTLLTAGKYKVADPSLYHGLLIAYTSKHEDQETALLFGLERGQQKVIGNFAGATRMPSFSPDGHAIAMICDANNHADICLIDTATNKVVRTIAHEAFDAYPRFSPDGRNLVFESDKLGSRGVYITSATGEGLRRLGDDSIQLGMPAWSPDGTRVAVVEYLQDGQRIATIGTDGTDLQEVSTGTNDSQPAWSPNSDALLFTRATPSGNQLWKVDIYSHQEKLVSTQGAAGNATWSSMGQ